MKNTDIQVELKGGKVVMFLVGLPTPGMKTPVELTKKTARQLAVALLNMAEGR